MTKTNQEKHTAMLREHRERKIERRRAHQEGRHLVKTTPNTLK